MADRYVYSAAAGTATGADWTNAHLTLAAAMTAAAGNDRVFVAHDHAETQASAMTIVGNNTGAASPIHVVCVNRAGSVPPVAADLRTTATVTTTGANAMTLAGNNANVYVYGIAFSAGSGATNVALNIATTGNSQVRWAFERCALAKKGTTAVGTAIIIGNAATNQYSEVEFKDCTVEFGATGDSIVVRATRFDWANTTATGSAIAGATIPTLLFAASTSGGAVDLIGLDLSSISGTLFSTWGVSAVSMQDCRLHASVTVRAAANESGIAPIILTRADSAGTNYRHEKYAPFGSQVVETTIVRTGGASDGTTPLAWKFVSTSRAKWITPFVSLPLAVWLDTTASVTLTLYGIWGGGAVPTQDDLWMEATYLGSASYPLGYQATSGKATYLTTAASHTADGSTWGGSTTAFKMTVTFTPAQKGFVSVIVKVGRASTTVYIDPKIAVS